MAPAWLWCIIRHGGGGSWKENEKQIISLFNSKTHRQIWQNPAITIQKEKPLFTQISINCAITFNLRHAGNDLSNKQQLCDIGLSRTSANRQSPSSVPPPLEKSDSRHVLQHHFNQACCRYLRRTASGCQCTELFSKCLTPRRWRDTCSTVWSRRRLLLD